MDNKAGNQSSRLHYSGPATRGSKSVEASPSKSKSDSSIRGGTDSPFFNSIRSPRKKYFTINPEWVSESLNVKKMSIRDGGEQPKRSATLGREGSGQGSGQGTGQRVIGYGGVVAAGDTHRSRRCKSAPPPLTRNPITWERPDVSGRSKSNKRETFVVHPEWTSENPNAKRTPRMTSSKARPTMENRFYTFPPRRCRSAPPVRTRNPITWENATVQGR